MRMKILVGCEYSGKAPSPDRWKKRSETYSGIAKAMATQWGGAE